MEMLKPLTSKLAETGLDDSEPGAPSEIYSWFWNEALAGKLAERWPLPALDSALAGAKGTTSSSASAATLTSLQQAGALSGTDAGLWSSELNAGDTEDALGSADGAGELGSATLGGLSADALLGDASGAEDAANPIATLDGLSETGASGAWSAAGGIGALSPGAAIGGNQAAVFRALNAGGARMFPLSNELLRVLREKMAANGSTPPEGAAGPGIPIASLSKGGTHAIRRSSSGTPAARAGATPGSPGASGGATPARAGPSSTTGSAKSRGVAPTPATTAQASPDSQAEDASGVEKNSALQNLITRVGRLFQLPVNLIRAVVHVESSGQADAVSSKGAIGLMQIMPQTAREMGIQDPRDSWENLYAGTKYLSLQLDRFGSVDKALAAYNAGPGAVAANAGIPPIRETKDYVRRVLEAKAAYDRSHPEDA